MPRVSHHGEGIKYLVYYRWVEAFRSPGLGHDVVDVLELVLPERLEDSLLGGFRLQPSGKRDGLQDCDFGTRREAVLGCSVVELIADTNLDQGFTLRCYMQGV